MDYQTDYKSLQIPMDSRIGVGGTAPEPSILQVLQALGERIQQLEKQCAINADEARFIRARLGI